MRILLPKLYLYAVHVYIQLFNYKYVQIYGTVSNSLQRYTMAGMLHVVCALEYKVFESPCYGLSLFTAYRPDYNKAPGPCN